MGRWGRGDAGTRGGEDREDRVNEQLTMDELFVDSSKAELLPFLPKPPMPPML